MFSLKNRKFTLAKAIAKNNFKRNHENLFDNIYGINSDSPYK